MAIPNINQNDILEALKYIDENGVPLHNQRTRYELVREDGKKYSPKYVIAVADHLANGGDITTTTFRGAEAREFLQEHGFRIEVKQEKYELSITAESIISTDESFTMDDLILGNDYRPLDVYFQKANGEVIKRKYDKGERRNSNQTLPRLACQIFEKQIAALSVEEKESFPICQYKSTHEIIRGIYLNLDGFRKHRKTIEYLVYNYDNGRQFVFYCWNIFSTLLFVRECLKRFGEKGDRFVLLYREKDEKSANYMRKRKPFPRPSLALKVNTEIRIRP